MVLEIKVAPSCNATLVTLFHPLPPRGKIRQKSYSGWSHARSASDVVAHLNRASKIWLVGEVVGAGGASLGGPYGAAKAHCCVAGR